MNAAWRQLARDWRAGELRLLALALAIAVASVTSVGFFGDRVGQALARDAHQLMGADIVLVADHPWPKAIADRVRAAGPSAEAVNFVSMARHGGETQLAGVKAVSDAYPLRGKLRTAVGLGAPDGPAERAPGPGTAWLEERLVSALQAPVGSTVRLGRSELRVAAVLTLEPERSTGFFNLAPRLLMNIADVPATGLVRSRGCPVLRTLRATASRRASSRLLKVRGPAPARSTRTQSSKAGSLTTSSTRSTSRRGAIAEWRALTTPSSSWVEARLRAIEFRAVRRTVWLRVSSFR